MGPANVWPWASNLDLMASRAFSGKADQFNAISERKASKSVFSQRTASEASPASWLRTLRRWAKSVGRSSGPREALRKACAASLRADPEERNQWMWANSRLYRPTFSNRPENETELR